MTELTYMTRADWGQHGTAMEPQSAVIREWLDVLPCLFVTSDLKRFREPGSADREFFDYVAAGHASQRVVELSQLTTFLQRGSHFNGTVAVIHPYEERDCEMLRKLVQEGKIERLFVIVWSPNDLIRVWLDGLEARNLHTGEVVEAPDPVVLEAAKCMVDEQYNGLSTGNGKAVVVQLLRAFIAQGYPLERDLWLRAFFAASGKFRHAGSISKLISEMKRGVTHRITNRYRSDIFDALRQQASAREEPSAG